MNVAAIRKETAMATPLKVLVPMIKQELEAGDQAGVEHYRRAGGLLIEAKDQVAHGEWGAWLKRNFHRSPTQAKVYMRLAEAFKTTPRRRFESLGEAMRSINPESTAGQSASWHEPVREVLNKVNYEALRQDDLKRTEGRELERKLGLQLIDIGFKVLAQKLHPDKKGGSQESFVRLKSVRDRLKTAV